MRLLAHSLAALAALILVPIGLLALLLRPSRRSGWVERLGGGTFTSPGAIWVHASSVGEARAAASLIDALRRSRREAFVSVNTSTGVEALRQGLPDVTCIRAPIDHPWCVERALARIRPAALVLVETELWPFIIAAADRRGIPVVVASGRLSDRSFPRYLWLRRLLAPTLARIAAVGARTARDAERFIALGVPAARVSLTGDLKLEPPTGNSEPAPEVVKALSGAPVFVAGSTHPGEESAALEVLDACDRAGLPVTALVAPRHPDRVPGVEKELRRSGRRVLRRGALSACGREAVEGGVEGAEGEILSAGEILLLDTVGELAGIYCLASVAFVGGSLAPVGGHNLLEPLVSGCPVLFGPHVGEIESQVALAVETGAGVPVADASELAEAVALLLEDSCGTRERGRRAAEEIARRGGSARRVAALIEAVLDQRSGAGDGDSRAEAGDEAGPGFIPPGSGAALPRGPQS